jgi:hypothetical protein
MTKTLWHPTSRKLLLHCGLLFHCSPALRRADLMPFMFENLQVYQRDIDFADWTRVVTDSFPGG